MLLQLPNELLSLILRSVDDDDIASFMVVNHQIHELMLPIFSHRHFHILAVKLTNTDRLERVASCNVYRQAVFEVKMEVTYIWDEYGKLSWPRDEHGSLMPHPNLTKFQAIMATKFPNCSKISVCGSGCMGRASYLPIRHLPSVSETLGFAFEAMAQTTSRIRSFAVDFMPKGERANTERQFIPRSPSPAFWIAWSQLQTLHIAARGSPPDYDHSDLSNLILKANGLKKLRFEYSLATTPDNPVWLYTNLVAASVMPKITHLHLSHENFTSSHALINLLKRFENHLEHLFINHTMIESGNWQDVCLALRRGFPKLASIALSWCYISDGFEPLLCKARLQLLRPLKNSLSESECYDFQFHEVYNRKIGGNFCVGGVRYAGKNVQWALEVIQDAIYPDISPAKDPWMDRMISRDLQEINRFNDPEFDF